MAQGGPLVTDWPLLAGTRFEVHVHEAHQLSFATRSAFATGVDERTWVVPPARALWIPAGVWHSVEAIGAAEMRALWIDPASCPLTWDGPTVVDVDPLVTLLVQRLGDRELDEAERTRTQAVLFDVLRPVEAEALDLVLPTDDRARRVADALLLDPADARSLVDWGREVGASDRTLMRSFRAETGLGFADWRTRARMAAAVRLLLTNRPIATIATDVGYATTSAFDAAFRRTMGVPPSTYRVTSRPLPRDLPAATSFEP
jgi:AraC-like DNA-binding protein